MLWMRLQHGEPSLVTPIAFARIALYFEREVAFYLCVAGKETEHNLKYIQAHFIGLYAHIIYSIKVSPCVSV